MTGGAFSLLIVEDDETLAMGLSDLFADAGYAVTLAATGEAALADARARLYDAVILDLMLPGLDGFDVCCELKTRTPRVPILMLSARTGSPDKVRGLRLGADDYVAKPFDSLELLARVEALIRRATLASRDACWTVDDVRLDVGRGEVYRDGRPVRLSAREFQLLVYLIEHRGELLSREQLQRDVWGFSSDVSSRTVDVHVARLRRKLERNAAAPRLIMTVQGLGYRFKPS
jgi:two-component system alkaline phosphatase synthesis response regulator PhoP